MPGRVIRDPEVYAIEVPIEPEPLVLPDQIPGYEYHGEPVMMVGLVANPLEDIVMPVEEKKNKEKKSARKSKEKVLSLEQLEHSQHKLIKVEQNSIFYDASPQFRRQIELGAAGRPETSDSSPAARRHISSVRTVVR